MGAWGAGIFENDDALDWVGEFLDAPSPGMLQRTLRAVTEADGDLDADPSCSALAAAEVLAAARGNPAAGLPDELRDWARGNARAATPALIGEAIAAIDRISHSSELRDLWNEGDQATTWTRTLEDLRVRLTSRGKGAPE